MKNIKHNNKLSTKQTIINIDILYNFLNDNNIDELLILYKNKNIVFDLDYKSIIYKSFDYFYSIYDVFICDTDKMQTFFLLFNFFAFQNIKFFKKKCIIGMDFEYGTNNIELMQIIFDIQDFDKKFIFLFTPKFFFNPFILNFFIKKILSNPNVTKILCGAESIDLKHLKDEIFSISYNTSIDSTIIKFFFNYIDIKFICTYFNEKINTIDKFCNVYEVYLSTNSIDEIFYNKLKKIQENYLDDRKKIHMITNVKQIYDSFFQYAVHDVLFLIKSYNYYLWNYQYETNINKELQFIIFVDKNIDSPFVFLKNIVNDSNNNFIINNNETIFIFNLYNKSKMQNISLVTLFNLFLENFLSEYSSFKNNWDLNDMLIIYYLYNVNFYKIYILWLLKFLFFYNIVKKYNNNKNNIFIKKNLPIDINSFSSIELKILNFFDKYHLYNLKKIFLWIDWFFNKTIN